MWNDELITIKVDCTNNPPTVKVDKPIVKVKKGNNVSWICFPEYPFAILFKSDTPFNKMAHAWEPKDPLLKVNVTKVQGEYNYAIAVACPQGAGVLDPKIIVE